MPVAEGSPIYRFDVSVSDRLDNLLLRPRGINEVRAVGALRHFLSGAPHMRRSAAGICVPPLHATPLLSPPSDFDLRWSDDAHRFLTNRRRARRVCPSVHAALSALRRAGVPEATAMVSDSAGLAVLDGHQVVNVAAMTLPSGFGLCVFDEQGAGKTVTTIYAYDLLAARDEADQLLIVAPKSMVPEWPKDFARFRGGLYRVTSVTGTVREKRAALTLRADVYVTNFETVVSLEAPLRALLRRALDRSVLVVDESFLIKSPDARRTRALRRLREWCGRAFVLCGTPAPNSPHDLVEQFNLVDFGLAFDGVDVPRDRDLAAPVVRQVVKDRGLYVRHLKADVLPDLPARSYHRLYVPMRPAQRDLYDALRDRLVTDLRSVSDAQFRRDYTHFLARRSALLQTCSHPASVAPDHTETPAKFLVLDDLLGRLVRTEGEKVVLWSFYTATIDALVERYRDFGVLRYDGCVPDVAERARAVTEFQEGEESRLLVANPAAAGAGLTLHRARLAVYESMSNQAAHYLQSLDRVHRRGQGRDVEYVILLCPDTLEVVEYDRLLDKQRMAGDLLGDPPADTVTRESMLAELSPMTSHLRPGEGS